MANTTTFSAAMKTKFIGPIRDQLNSNSILLFGLRSRDDTTDVGMPHGSKDFKGIQADSTGIDFVGNDFRMPLHTGRNQGTGPRTEGATLPGAGQQSFKYLTDTLKYYYGLFTISGPLLKASESNEGAFRKALELEMTKLSTDLKRHLNIHGYGDGTGGIATITTGTTSVTQPVSSTVNLQVGDTLDIYASGLGGSPRNAVARTVVSIARSSLTVTLDASVATTTNDVIVKAAPNSTTGTPNNDVAAGAINGLQKIIKGSGVLHGLDPSTETYWVSTAVAAASAVVGDTLLRQVRDNIGFESGGDSNTVFITTRGIRNRYASTLTPLKQFTNSESVTLHGGFKALMFDEDPMVYDDQCPIGTVFAVDMDAMFWSQMSDWEWMEEDGKTLKWVPTTDSYTGVLFKYCNLGTYARNRHGIITGAADDTK